MKDTLRNLPVLLSASIPEAISGDRRNPMPDEALTRLVRHILAAGGQVLSGGHPSIVPLVYRAARESGRTRCAVLYLLERFRDQAPPEIQDSAVFDRIHWIGDGSGSLEDELTELREAMVAASRAAVFLGGKTERFIGPLPGVRDEYQRFTRQHAHAPVYLLGFLNGETGRIIQELERTGSHEINTLSDADRNLLHDSDNMDRVAPVLLADLERTLDGGMQDRSG